MPGYSGQSRIEDKDTALQSENNIFTCKKNDEFIIDIEDLGTDGEGIGKIQGYTLFVKDALTGDKVRVKIMKAKKKYAYAKLLEIIEPSEWRTEPACPVAKQCGGCQLQHCSYEKQLEWKRKKIQDCLNRIGGFTDIQTEPVIGMDIPYYYRNKAQFPVGYDKDGNIVTGFYAGRTHSIIPFKNCLVQHPCSSAILETVTKYMEENKVSAYNETNHKGIVRHILIRTAQATGEVMVCLIINADKLPYADKLVKMLLECSLSQKSGNINGINNNFNENSFIKSICININKENTNVILGNSIEVLYGTPYITDYIGEVVYHISPLSFYQVNYGQTVRLYEKVM